MLVKGTITVKGGPEGAGEAARQRDKRKKRSKNFVLKDSAPFTHCISKKNNTQIVNVKDLDVVIPMYKYQL